MVPAPTSTGDTHFYGFGITGRFGNQHIQYMVLRALEHIHGVTVRFSPWIGDHLYEETGDHAMDPDHVFGEIDTNPHSHSYLTRFGGQKLCMDGEADPARKRFVDLGEQDMFDPAAYSIAGRDIYHDAYLHTAVLRPWEQHLRRQCVLREPLRGEFEDALASLRRERATLVVLHVRNDDFVLVPDPHFASQTHLYERWLEQRFATLERPYVYLCGQYTQRDRERCARFNARTIDDWEHLAGEGAADASWRAMAFDHFMLRQADHVLCSNSTFAFTGAMLNERGGHAYRADLDRDRMARLDPWDAFTYASAPSHWQGAWQRLKREPLYPLRCLAFLCRRVLTGRPLMHFSLASQAGQDLDPTPRPQASACRQPQ